MVIYVRRIVRVVRVAAFMAVFLTLGAVNAQTPDLDNAVALAESSPVVLRIGVYNNPPKTFVNDEQRPDGMFWHLLEQIAIRERWQLETVVCEWNACLLMLEQGAIDLMPDVAMSDIRRERFAFKQEPALLSWSQLFERDGLGILSLLDIEQKRIAVLQGSVQYAFLLELVRSFNMNVQWVILDTIEQAFIAVADGRADAVVSNHFYGDQQALQHGFTRTPVIFQPIQLYFATAIGRHAAILERIDSYLINWKADPSSPYFEALSAWDIEPPLSFVPN